MSIPPIVFPSLRLIVPSVTGASPSPLKSPTSSLPPAQNRLNIASNNKPPLSKKDAYYNPFMSKDSGDDSDDTPGPSREELENTIHILEQKIENHDDSDSDESDD